MLRVTLSAGLMLMAAACSDPAPPAAPVNATAPSGENYAAIVTGLDPEARKGVLFRAIRDAGLACQQVTEVNTEAAMRGAPVWRARCEDGNYHLVQVTPDGTATVISRAGN